MLYISSYTVIELAFVYVHLLWIVDILRHGHMLHNSDFFENNTESFVTYVKQHLPLGIIVHKKRINSFHNIFYAFFVYLFHLFSLPISSEK